MVRVRYRFDKRSPQSLGKLCRVRGPAGSSTPVLLLRGLPPDPPQVRQMFGSSRPRSSREAKRSVDAHEAETLGEEGSPTLHGGEAASPGVAPGRWTTSDKIARLSGLGVSGDVVAHGQSAICLGRFQRAVGRA